MKSWVYKNNKGNEHYQRAYGDWEEFFDVAGQQAWGGNWAFGKRSRNYLSEDVSVGDEIVCYQTDRRAIIGIAKVSQVTQGTNAELFLTAVRKLPTPVRIHRLKNQGGMYEPLQRMDVWRAGPISSLYPLDAADARFMRRLLTGKVASD